MGAKVQCTARWQFCTRGGQLLAQNLAWFRYRPPRGCDLYPGLFHYLSHLVSCQGVLYSVSEMHE